MGVILTTYKSWSDPSSGPYQVCRKGQEKFRMWRNLEVHILEVWIGENSPRKSKPHTWKKGDEPNVEKPWETIAFFLGCKI